MTDMVSVYWPHILLALSILVGGVAAAHAAMTKEDVRSAAGWVGVIMLSPLLGALIYLVAGINRIRHAALATRRSVRHQFDRQPHAQAVPAERIEDEFGKRFMALNHLGDAVARFRMCSGNSVTLLETGDIAYAEICAAVDAAREDIILESYIFDRDRIGKRIAGHLLQAKARGVQVRILVDAVGARYSFPSIIRFLRDNGIDAKTFNGNVITGLRLPYANLRTHRKIIVIDGTIAFTGGMNIREAFTSEFSGSDANQDTHFKVAGPIVRDLHAVTIEDWNFATGERLAPVGQIPTDDPDPENPVYMRVVSSGPDASLETNQKMLIGAFSVASTSIRIMSPYFLPDRELISALVTAARRGVRIDIVVPRNNNLRLVDLAMSAQFDQVLKYDCHIWKADGGFNHSKLLTIDGCWSYVGTSNIDPRSMRLNFEVDLEVLDQSFARQVEARIDSAIDKGIALTLKNMRERPFPIRLLEKFIWLGSPYL